ncbi:hypothetical protein [Marmoricola sp. RAF53]|uniref:hypothetical protein n=1 Tax=Marmoricola sp. RAF53 TaxID=3233059 RepID=UPI003F9B3CA1
MSTQVKVTAFVGGLFVLFLAAFNVGRIWAEEPPSYVLSADADPGTGTLRVSLEDGGEPVQDLVVRHEKRLHLIAVSEDFSRYHHLHPYPQDSDVDWLTQDALEPGRWRLYADFQEKGREPAVATTRIDVAGAPPAGGIFPATGEVTESEEDGYRVALLGDLKAGGENELRFRISEDGVPVTDLQPYLGAYGHLVVLREQDGAYQHAHPHDGPSGPVVAFDVDAPTAGRYHLYLDYRHGGEVRTAHFALQAAKADGHGEGMDHGDH